VSTIDLAPPRHGGVADAMTLIGRSIRLGRRNADTLVMSIVLPLLMMTLFVYVFGGAIQTGTEYINYVVPGIVLLCTGYGAASTAMSVANDMTTGMVDRLRSMPIRSSAVLIGHVTASVARNMLSTTIVIGAAVAMGFRPNAGFGEWLLVAGLLLLYVLALSWLAAGLGVIAKTVESASTLSFFMLFIPYRSSAFVPTDTMPAFLRPISEHAVPAHRPPVRAGGQLTGVTGGTRELVERVRSAGGPGSRPRSPRRCPRWSRGAARRRPGPQR
jgi:ABC-2 type transport system permease protein